ncbi:glycerol transporter [Alkalihalobacillus alcalophilus ATCC 27647 = CGMCC 1.3604]|uniref:Glycerol transporter n=1 Tax=Alkalihalobacillus alcalophilus ATCC 27647 = CGMCC 1.3604 TaxID=1218173 RepID=J8TDJ4_ALKAL|nr:MIP/aquaporin family protein [Alkalihalobacillus alcalophilus]AFV25706.1 glycerol uptake transporter [Alkalihalobacillus alcalophilus ATCC 27647 = CGMCC 1.3604]KGA99056.1 glycerol transporter [Alkalihalobacillus alcalophilus ATCC 27647 = CGMCC 1.3604]MED1560701.1 aquaporin family protein [Alkalihalobacillus alcalophilus]THG89797.1 glycerol transporter [Alkalihalobacillus alcalophilus ATCC 27647 = CGMCC 1.3604]
MSAFLGEVIGTMILIIFGGGVVAGVNLKKTYSNSGGWVVVTLAWGLAVTMGVFAVGSISGAHLNPAVTLGLAVTGDFLWADVPLYMIAQVTGAFIGGVIVFLHYLPHWRATTDQGAKLAVFSTGPAIPNTFANLLSEMIGTFILVLGLLFIGANSFTEGLNPIAVGLLIVAIGMSLGGTTGYAINPARDLGPRIAHFLLPIHGKGSSNWRYAWIPVVGPLMGGALGAIFYQVFFAGMISTITWVVLGSVIAILVLTLIFGKKESSLA